MTLRDLSKDFCLNNDIQKYLQDYAEILLHWNKTHNLTGMQNLDDIYENFLDSIYPLNFIHSFQSCMDVGSGAGFPALPLAICNPNSRFILVEPRIKRASFLSYVVLELGLSNTEIRKSRIEDVDILDMSLDLITSRAVMPSADLIKYTKRFLKKNGYYLFYKGAQLYEEISCEENECFLRKNRIYFYRKEA